MAIREKSVSIPESLFVDLVSYMLLENQSEENLKRIKKGLDEKLNRIAEHDLYSRYKTAPTEEEKEKARLEYLERKKIPSQFRY